VSRLSLYYQEVGQLERRFQGERIVPGEYFLVSTKLDTFCYLTVQTAPCYTYRRFDTIPACQTDGQTDGIAVASIALVMRALPRAVKKTRNPEHRRAAAKPAVTIGCKLASFYHLYYLQHSKNRKAVLGINRWQIYAVMPL